MTLYTAGSIMLRLYRCMHANLGAVIIIGVVKVSWMVNANEITIVIIISLCHAIKQKI